MTREEMEKKVAEEFTFREGTSPFDGTMVNTTQLFAALVDSRMREEELKAGQGAERVRELCEELSALRAELAEAKGSRAKLLREAFERGRRVHIEGKRTDEEFEIEFVRFYAQNVEGSGV